MEAKPEAEVKWFKDRQLLVSQPAHLEQTGSELMFFQMSDDDTGDYYCQATNYLGSIESENFRLTVQSSKYTAAISEESSVVAVVVSSEGRRGQFVCSNPQGRRRHHNCHHHQQHHRQQEAITCFHQNRG